MYYKLDRKDEVYAANNRKKLNDNLRRGTNYLIKSKPGKIMFVIFIITALIAAIINATTVLLSLIIFSLLVYAAGRPWIYNEFSLNLFRAGLINAAKETPTLIHISNGHTKNAKIYHFESIGIPIDLWNKRRMEVESALGVYIVDLRHGKDNQVIEITAVPANTTLGDNIKLTDEKIENYSDNILVLGESHIGQVTMDVSKHPHTAIGGASGSGKTVLVKSLVFQCLKKGCVTYIADFKGGLDYIRMSHFPELMLDTDEYEFLKTLDIIASKAKSRKEILEQAKALNIDEYNKNAVHKMSRIFVIIDEMGELFDKVGASKERKELLYQIENRITTMARMYRMVGIHLIAVTQRPDSNVMPGQIRSNIDNRICGRADSILSTIILGDGRAHEMIPKSSVGRFITNDGTVFQGYNVEF